MIAKGHMPPLRYADSTARAPVHMPDFRIQFKVFEGPMDLLLFLVKKQEVDVYEVNMTELATQFIDYVELMQRLDLELAGEFIVMASTLMYIKSRELLPVDEQVEDTEDDDAGDPRWDLIRRLVEYRRFKDASDDLQRLEIEREKVYTRRIRSGCGRGRRCDTASKRRRWGRAAPLGQALSRRQRCSWPQAPSGRR